MQLPAWKIGDRGFETPSSLQVSKNKMFLPRSLVKIQYCGELPSPRGSELGLKPSGLQNFEGSVISPSSGGSPGPAWPICAQMWPEIPFISFHCHKSIRSCCGSYCKKNTVKSTKAATKLLKGHLKKNSVSTDCNLSPQIQPYGHRFKVFFAFLIFI